MAWLTLGREGLLVLDGRKTREVVCHEGRVWLSFGARDIVLKANERWSQPRPRREHVLIQALNEYACLEVTSHGTRRLPWLWNRRQTAHK